MKETFSQDIEGYKENIKKAKEIVEELNLEEPYKTNAFNTLLKDLLSKKGYSNDDSTSRIDSNSAEKSSLQFNMEEIPYFEDFDNLKWKDKILNLLQWARHNHPERGLITSELVDIFHERFAISYVDSGKINKEVTRRLVKTPFITRKRINQRDFRWFITPRGEEYLKKENKNEISS